MKLILIIIEVAIKNSGNEVIVIVTIRLMVIKILKVVVIVLVHGLGNQMWHKKLMWDQND